MGTSDFAISIEGLGKRYAIRHEAARPRDYRSLSETLSRGGAALVRRLRPLRAATARERGEWEDFWALRNATFEVGAGEAVGIVGRNGAGKSTLLKLLSRITEPTEGRIRLRGRVASLLEVGTGFHPELTGRENIYLNGAILGMTRAEIRRNFESIVAFSEVERFIDTPVKRYSSGMYVRLAFAVAAHLEPEILLVDEVLAVGDLAFQKKCLGKMDEVARGKGRTVLFVSHQMDTVAALCTRVLMIEGGRVAADGAAGDVIAAYRRSLLERGGGNGGEERAHFAPAHGLGIRRARVAIVEGAEGAHDLEISFEVFSERSWRELQIGLEIRTYNGMRVASLAPKMTGFALENVEEPVRCTFTCRDVGSQLAGGEYIVGAYLRRPAEVLLQVEEIGRFSLVPGDLYELGTAFELERHGLVPLRLEFRPETPAHQAAPS